MSCIEQVLEATPHKTVAVWPLKIHPEIWIIRQTRHVRHCWRSEDEHKRCTPVDLLTWTSKGWMTS